MIKRINQCNYFDLQNELKPQIFTMLPIALFTVAMMLLCCADLQAAHYTPIMGWSSWNTYHVDISDSLIMRQADALVDLGLKDAGYTYINVDDGYFGYRDAEGQMFPHPQRFPRGMRYVSDYIHGLGLKAGIYAEAGDNTCGSIWDNDANGVGSGLYGTNSRI